MDTKIFDVVAEHIRDNLPEMVGDQVKHLLKRNEELVQENEKLKKEIDGSRELKGKIEFLKQKLNTYKELADEKAELAESKKELDALRREFEIEKVELRNSLEQEKSKYLETVNQKILTALIGNGKS